MFASSGARNETEHPSGNGWEHLMLIAKHPAGWKRAGWTLDASTYSIVSLTLSVLTYSQVARNRKDSLKSWVQRSRKGSRASTLTKTQAAGASIFEDHEQPERNTLVSG